MDIKRIISDKLNEIEEKEQVRILHAVESGSRAWGFASPDSDYDVRFVYVRKKESYLSLNRDRDVIEWQLDETLDINGWDLDKALKLFHRSNATLFEWANSPVVYRTTDIWKQIVSVTNKYFSKKSSMYHYYGTANGNYMEYLLGDEVKYKKYFYVIRPLLACKWIEEKGTPPPVLFTELLDTVLDHNMKDCMNQLLEIKKKSDEAYMAKPISELNLYIERLLKKYKTLTATMADDRLPDWEPLNRLFFEIVEK